MEHTCNEQQEDNIDGGRLSAELYTDTQRLIQCMLSRNNLVQRILTLLGCAYGGLVLKRQRCRKRRGNRRGVERRRMGVGCPPFVEQDLVGND